MAHPDDESMGTGGLLLRHARAGIDVHLICATRGEEGWGDKPPGARKEDLPEIRTAELYSATTELGLRSVELWRYPDGGVTESDQTEITNRVLESIRRLRPAAVVGWGPDGGYGHPDHIAVGRCTDAAVLATPPAERPALYHLAVDEQGIQSYKDMFKLAGIDAGSLPLVVADRFDVTFDLTGAEVAIKLKAIDCHESQLEEWRVQVRHHSDLLQRGYGHEVYVTVASSGSGLTRSGLLPEFA